MFQHLCDSICAFDRNAKIYVRGMRNGWRRHRHDNFVAKDLCNDDGSNNCNYKSWATAIAVAMDVALSAAFVMVVAFRMPNVIVMAVAIADALHIAITISCQMQIALQRDRCNASARALVNMYKGCVRCCCHPIIMFNMHPRRRWCRYRKDMGRCCGDVILKDDSNCNCITTRSQYGVNESVGDDIARILPDAVVM